jgi:hypothetical protein
MNNRARRPSGNASRIEERGSDPRLAFHDHPKLFERPGTTNEDSNSEFIGPERSILSSPIPTIQVAKKFRKSKRSDFRRVSDAKCLRIGSWASTSYGAGDFIGNDQGKREKTREIGKAPEPGMS